MEITNETYIQELSETIDKVEAFGVIAEFWEAYLKATNPGAEINIDGADVAALMALFKIARIATGTQKADSWIDAAGYIACGAEIAEGTE